MTACLPTVVSKRSQEVSKQFLCKHDRLKGKQQLGTANAQSFKQKMNNMLGCRSKSRDASIWTS